MGNTILYSSENINIDTSLYCFVYIAFFIIFIFNLIILYIHYWKLKHNSNNFPLYEKLM